MDEPTLQGWKCTGRPLSFLLRLDIWSAVTKLAVGSPMKSILLIAVLGMAVQGSMHAQGQFLFYNNSAPTRLGTIDGPLAGNDIYAAMLAGPLADSLLPFGPILAHQDGLVGGILEVAVPTVPCNSFGFVQMVAWDSRLWGTSLASVPPDQLGRTDVVRMVLACGSPPVFAPIFTQPAVVPVPEPSVLVLCSLGGGILLFIRRWRTGKGAEEKETP